MTQTASVTFNCAKLQLVPLPLMKGKLFGWVLSAVFIVAVVAIAMRIPFVKGLISGNAAAKAA